MLGGHVLALRGRGPARVGGADRDEGDDQCGGQKPEEKEIVQADILVVTTLYIGQKFPLVFNHMKFNQLTFQLVENFNWMNFSTE